MSDKRLQELGIPRRPFLKRMIGGAFAAPVVVSFGLGGIAEADTPTYNNQVCYPNQTVADYDFSEALGDLAAAESSGDISHGVANSVRKKLVNAQAYADGGDFVDACSLLGALQNELKAQSGKHITASTAGMLSWDVGRIQSALDCGCFLS